MKVDAARHDRRPTGGFSIVELLVVIAVIALLTAIVAPALSHARQAGVETACSHNLRQIALAMTAYEMDAGRLPPHASEHAGGPGLKPWCVKSGAFDGRDLYRDYMPLEYWRCPELPELDYAASDAANMFSNYLIFPGYVERRTDGQWSSAARWKRTSDLWSVVDEHHRERRCSVLVADKLYRDDSAYTVVNHPGSADFELLQMDTAGAFGTAFRRDSATDRRADFVAGAAFADGHVRRLAGADAAFVDVHDRSTGRILIPTD